MKTSHPKGRIARQAGVSKEEFLLVLEEVR